MSKEESLKEKIIITSTPKGEGFFYQLYQTSLSRVIIGSAALKHHFPDFNRLGSGKDIDYLVEHEFFKSTKNTEYHVIPALWEYIDKEQKYIDINILYTLKISHSYWNIHWEKTIHDIVFMTEKGCIINEELHQKLYSYWSEKHRSKKVNLNQDTKDFFNKNVTRKFEHDYLHEVVKYYDVPLYKNLLVDPNKPLMCKDKFFAQSYLDQIRTVKEEAYAIALEREYIPERTSNWKVAYMRALKILITSASKGWFPTFMVLNYKELYKSDLDIKQVKLKLNI